MFRIVNSDGGSGDSPQIARQWIIRPAESVSDAPNEPQCKPSPLLLLEQSARASYSSANDASLAAAESSNGTGAAVAEAKGRAEEARRGGRAASSSA